MGLGGVGLGGGGLYAAAPSASTASASTAARAASRIAPAPHPCRDGRDTALRSGKFGALFRPQHRRKCCGGASCTCRLRGHEHAPPRASAWSRGDDAACITACASQNRHAAGALQNGTGCCACRMACLHVGGACIRRATNAPCAAAAAAAASASHRRLVAGHAVLARGAVHLAPHEVDDALVAPRQHVEGLRVCSGRRGAGALSHQRSAARCACNVEHAAATLLRTV